MTSVTFQQNPPDIYDFARLIPANAHAINAFTEAFVQVVDGSDEYHLRFCVADVDKARRIHRARVGLHDGTSNDVRTAFQMVDGFYRLGLDSDSLPDLMQGWRIGRGNRRVTNRGVELLMLHSDSLDALSILHCRFRLHPQTGVLLVKSMTKDRKVSYFFRGQEVVVRHGEERPLCQRENTVFIGDLKFTLEYTVPLDEEGHGEFLALLNGALEAAGDPYHDPPLAFGFLPSDPSNSLHRNYLLSHNTRACGGFGWIHAAIDTSTGDAAAVKALQLKRDFDRQEALREARMWTDINDTDHVLELLDCWCEHGKQFHECKKLPEKVYLSSPLGRFDLYSKSWQEVPWRDQLTMLRQTLEGLAGLHRRGVMHRDISGKNMLVMSLKPPLAVIHDFGKATRSLNATQQQLGPIPSVAPEVDGSHRYNNLIDAWSWAYSVMVSFGYARTARTKITPQRLANLLNDIDDLEARKPHFRSLANLVRQMLLWDPTARTSVTSAVRHPCWDACSDRGAGSESDSEELEEEGGPAKKIKRTDTDASESSISSVSSVSSGRLVAVAAPAVPDTDPSEKLESTVPTQLVDQPA